MSNNNTSYQNQMSHQIARADGVGKILELRNNLSAAEMNEYATMHNAGGTKRAGYKSTIKCLLCDYSKGKGDNSVTVQTNLNIDVVYMLYEVAKSRLAAPSAKAYDFSKVKGMLRDLYSKLNGTPQWQNIVKSIGNELNATTATQKPDFTYSQDKVDTYRINNGIAPVSILTINRNPFRPNGEVSRNPWFIKITNGTAPVRTTKTGSQAYVGSRLGLRRKRLSIYQTLIFTACSSEP